MKLTRLEALPQTESAIRVDREGHGAIRGVSLATTGPALGHGFDLDETTIDQVAELFEGRAGRWTHGELSGDGLGQHLGRWVNLSTREIKIRDEETGEVNLHRQAVGDFEFSASGWKIQPDGLGVPAPEYLMDRAKEDPSTFGVSIVAQFAMLEERDADGSLKRRLGRIQSRKHAKRADFVADPAANPVGLHAGTGTMSEVHELAERHSALLRARLGDVEARARALSLVDSLFPAEDDTDQPQAATAAEDAMELKEALEALKKKDAELDALRESIKARDTQLEALRKREQDREEQDREAYLASLDERAKQAGAEPLSQDDRERVRKALGVDEEIGRDLGEAKLAALIERTRGTKTEPLAPQDDELGDAEEAASLIVSGGSLSSLKTNKKGA